MRDFEAFWETRDAADLEADALDALDPLRDPLEPEAEPEPDPEAEPEPLEPFEPETEADIVKK